MDKLKEHLKMEAILLWLFQALLASQSALIHYQVFVVFMRLIIML